jgi:hypothetical protein
VIDTSFVTRLAADLVSFGLGRVQESRTIMWLERFAKPRFVHAALAIKVDRPSTRASRWSSRLERLREDPGPRLIDTQAGRLSATSSQSIP